MFVLLYFAHGPDLGQLSYGAAVRGRYLLWSGAGGELAESCGQMSHWKRGGFTDGVIAGVTQWPSPPFDT